MPHSPDLVAARVRREALHGAMLHLEAALATPVGDVPVWRKRMEGAALDLRDRIEDHIDEVEADEGFLDSVVRESPRLARRADELRDDHVELRRAVQRLLRRLDETPDADLPDDADRIRREALDLLGHVARHRQRGSDLIYEAYTVDIGGWE